MSGQTLEDCFTAEKGEQADGGAGEIEMPTDAYQSVIFLCVPSSGRCGAYMRVCVYSLAGLK